MHLMSFLFNCYLIFKQFDSINNIAVSHQRVSKCMLNLLNQNFKGIKASIQLFHLLTHIYFFLKFLVSFWRQKFKCFYLRLQQWFFCLDLFGLGKAWAFTGLSLDVVQSKSGDDNLFLVFRLRLALLLGWQLLFHNYWSVVCLKFNSCGRFLLG